MSEGMKMQRKMQVLCCHLVAYSETTKLVGNRSPDGFCIYLSLLKIFLQCCYFHFSFFFYLWHHINWKCVSFPLLVKESALNLDVFPVYRRMFILIPEVMCPAASLTTSESLETSVDSSGAMAIRMDARRSLRQRVREGNVLFCFVSICILCETIFFFICGSFWRVCHWAHQSPQTCADRSLSEPTALPHERQ